MIQGTSQTSEKLDQEKSDIDEAIEALGSISIERLKHPWLSRLSTMVFILAFVSTVISFCPGGASWPRTGWLMITVCLIMFGLSSWSGAHGRWSALLWWLLAGLGQVAVWILLAQHSR